MREPWDTCEHTIRPNKYERNDPKLRTWWYKLFHFLEADAAAPSDERLERLNKIFPSEIDREFAKQCIQKLADAYGQLKTSTSDSSIHGSNYSVDYNTIKNNVGKINRYMKFLKRRPDRAAIWRTLPPLSLEEMNLSQKAEAITRAIAVDFTEWLDMIGEGTPKTHTVETIMQLFEIGFNTHAAKSLCVRLTEMPSIPANVANFHGVPHLAKRNQLHILLKQDLAASREEKKQFAFGQQLPNRLQCRPPNAELAEKFTRCGNVPEDLESMAMVWQGITHLRSTHGFCEWLLEHPDIKPPRYLVDNKMLDINVLRGRNQSNEGVVNPRSSSRMLAMDPE